MKTAISIPDHLFDEAEKVAQRLGMSRSELYTNAVSEYLREHKGEKVTEKLNEVYQQESSELDSVSHALQFASLIKDEW
jgi:metal-responsive CopG/Arc/MetJ family transcriptional regulator